jgi:hypothetical protein
MADKNIQMTQRNATNDGWDNINPITKAANVKLNSGVDVETSLADSLNILAPGGSANAITLSVTLADKKKYSFKATANSTGSVTINGIAFKKLDGTQIGSGGVKAGKVYDFYYDSAANCVFILAKADGDALVGDVLAGKGFSNGDDTGLIGTLALTGNVVAADVLNGKTFYNTDAKAKGTGNMPNRGTFNLALGAAVPAGYYSGGTVPSGKKYASGTGTTDSNGSAIVSGLSFSPRYIMVNVTNGYYNDGNTIWCAIVNLDWSSTTYIGKGTGTWHNISDYSGYVNSSGFKLATGYSSFAFNWIAFE